jgi:hypothetical protein
MALAIDCGNRLNNSNWARREWAIEQGDRPPKATPDDRGNCARATIQAAMSSD